MRNLITNCECVIRSILSSSKLFCQVWLGLQDLGVSIGILIAYPKTNNLAYVLIFSCAVIVASVYQLISVMTLSLKQQYTSNWLLTSVVLCLVAVFFFENMFGLMIGFSLNGLMTFKYCLGLPRAKPRGYGKNNNLLKPRTDGG